MAREIDAGGSDAALVERLQDLDSAIELPTRVVSNIPILECISITRTERNIQARVAIFSARNWRRY